MSWQITFCSCAAHVVTGHLHKSTQNITFCSCTVPLVVTYNRVHSTQHTANFAIYHISTCTNPHKTHALAQRQKAVLFYIFFNNKSSSQIYTLHSRSHLVLTELFTFLVCANLHSTHAWGGMKRLLYSEEATKYFQDCKSDQDLFLQVSVYVPLYVCLCMCV